MAFGEHGYSRFDPPIQWRGIRGRTLAPLLENGQQLDIQSRFLVLFVGLKEIFHRVACLHGERREHFPGRFVLSVLPAIEVLGAEGLVAVEPLIQASRELFLRETCPKPRLSYVFWNKSHLPRITGEFDGVK